MNVDFDGRLYPTNNAGTLTPRAIADEKVISDLRNATPEAKRLVASIGEAGKEIYRTAATIRDTDFAVDSQKLGVEYGKAVAGIEADMSTKQYADYAAWEKEYNEREKQARASVLAWAKGNETQAGGVRNYDTWKQRINEKMDFMRGTAMLQNMRAWNNKQLSQHYAGIDQTYKDAISLGVSGIPVLETAVQNDNRVPADQKQAVIASNLPAMLLQTGIEVGNGEIQKILNDGKFEQVSLILAQQDDGLKEVEKMQDADLEKIESTWAQMEKAFNESRDQTVAKLNKDDPRTNAIIKQFDNARGSLKDKFYTQGRKAAKQIYASVIRESDQLDRKEYEDFKDGVRSQITRKGAQRYADAVERKAASKSAEEAAKKAAVEERKLKLEAEEAVIDVSPDIEVASDEETERALSGQEKTKGFFGGLRCKGGRITTELGTTMSIDGKTYDVPLINPMLNERELKYLLNEMPTFEQMIQTETGRNTLKKAQAWAIARIAQGKSPSATKEEEGKTPLPTSGVVRNGSGTTSKKTTPDDEESYKNAMELLGEGDVGERGMGYVKTVAGLGEISVSDNPDLINEATLATLMDDASVLDPKTGLKQYTEILEKGAELLPNDLFTQLKTHVEFCRNGGKSSVTSDVFNSLQQEIKDDVLKLAGIDPGNKKKAKAFWEKKENASILKAISLGSALMKRVPDLGSAEALKNRISEDVQKRFRQQDRQQKMLELAERYSSAEDFRRLSLEKRFLNNRGNDAERKAAEIAKRRDEAIEYNQTGDDHENKIVEMLKTRGWYRHERIGWWKRKMLERMQTPEGEMEVRKAIRAGDDVDFIGSLKYDYFARPVARGLSTAWRGVSSFASAAASEISGRAKKNWEARNKSREQERQRREEEKQKSN